MALDIITQDNWSDSPAPGGLLRHPLHRVYIHCTVVPDVKLTEMEMAAIRRGDHAAIWRSLATDLGSMRAVDRAHKANGWAGLGYNFCGFDDGTVWEGRGWHHIGAQVEGHNSVSLGYAWFINGDKRRPTDEAWASFAQWMLLGMKAGIIAADFDLRPHRQDNHEGKSCPGRLILDGEINDLERWVKSVHAKG